MARERAVRMPRLYEARFSRCDRSDPRQLPIRGFRVRAWNKLDADVEARRELEAAGEDPKAWWYIGAERVKW